MYSYHEKDIALIILDVMMPKMDGWEVCREVRKNSKVPIIMLTARSDERDELLGFDLGVDEYIIQAVQSQDPGSQSGGNPSPYRISTGAEDVHFCRRYCDRTRQHTWQP